MSTIMQLQPPFHATTLTTRFCTHSRIIDNVLLPQGQKTGKVRCLECGGVFDDPALVQEQD
ncbi:MAG: hypothetical protein U0236_16270 [Nitrospira sp.]